MEERLGVLRKEYGILDYKSQVKNLIEEYYKMLAKGNSSPEGSKVKDELDNLKQKGVEYEKFIWTIMECSRFL